MHHSLLKKRADDVCKRNPVPKACVSIALQRLDVPVKLAGNAQRKMGV